MASNVIELMDPPRRLIHIAAGFMETFVTFGISLGLGLLVGLQRERRESDLGGIRTFPLITLFGTMCGFLGTRFGPIPIAAGFLTVLGILVLSNYLAAKQQKPNLDPGQTTEMSAVVMFAIGVYLVFGERDAAFVVTGVIVVLLHLKEPMHRFVRKMGERDMAAVMQFVVVTLVVLPILPDQTYGPYAVLNPFDIWRMVVLIVGISLVGYVGYKVLGERAGTLAGGSLGGLISSTATTVSYARRSRKMPGAESLAALVIMIASAIAYLRVLVEIMLVASGYAAAMTLPLGVMLVWTCALSGALLIFSRRDDVQVPEPGNPAELKSALIFGFLYALVIVAIGAVKHHFGQTALYGVAIVSGLTDMDAITVSTARMVAEERIDPNNGWRLILVASLANLVFKWAVVLMLGSRALAWRVAFLFALVSLGGLALFWFWPESWQLPPGGQRQN